MTPNQEPEVLCSVCETQKTASKIGVCFDCTALVRRVREPIDLRPSDLAFQTILVSEAPIGTVPKWISNGHWMIQTWRLSQRTRKVLEGGEMAFRAFAKKILDFRALPLSTIEALLPREALRRYMVTTEAKINFDKEAAPIARYRRAKCHDIGLNLEYARMLHLEHCYGSAPHDVVCDDPTEPTVLLMPCRLKEDVL